MGPYSGDLAGDYRSLANALSLGDEDYKERELQEGKKNALDSISSLLKVPDDISLEQSFWLELLASLHYLKKVVGLDESGAKEKITQQKENLSAFSDLAIAQLKNYKSLQFQD